MTPFLFLSGAALAYYVAMPLALRYLLGYQGNIGGITQEALPGVGNYLDFVTRFIFGFGVAFLLPVLLMLLERAGLVTRQQLKRGAALCDRRRLRGRGRADAAGRDLAAAARGPAGAALRILAGRDLVHRAQARPRGRRRQSLTKKGRPDEEAPFPSDPGTMPAGSLRPVIDRVRGGFEILAGAAHGVAGAGEEERACQGDEGEQLLHSLSPEPRPGARRRRAGMDA